VPSLPRAGEAEARPRKSAVSKSRSGERQLEGAGQTTPCSAPGDLNWGARERDLRGDPGLGQGSGCCGAGDKATATAPPVSQHW